MAGPQDWGATPVEEGGPQSWGAAPVLASGDDAGAPPQPFLDRIARGDALQRAIAPLTAALKGFGEGFGSEPLGLSDEHVQQLRDAGVFADPATGRGGAIRFMNEAVGQQIGVLGDIAARGASGTIGAVAGAVKQFVTDSKGALGNPQSAENEVKNFGNYLLLRGDHEFGRVDHSPAGPQDTPIGILPRDQDFKAGAAALDSPVAEQNLRDLWQDKGIHPAEAVNDAKSDAFLKHDLTTEPKAAEVDPEAMTTLAETGGMPAHGLGADVTTEPPIDTPLTTQPASPAARLMTAAHDATDKLFDIGRDMQMLIAPMARGTVDSMAIAKDFANTMRRNRWDWSRIDADIESRFDVEQRKRMWDAADEESVLRQGGQTSEHMGLATLEPEERQAVEDLQTRSQTAWLRARDIGMVEGEGLPSYTPRMVLNVATAGEKNSALSLNAMGRNLRTRTAQMLHRKYLTAEETEAAAKGELGDDATIARDIRALPLATANLEDAIAGRTLINNIKEYGKRTGDDTVVEGAIPADSPHKWFTMQEHPAFMQWRPKIDPETRQAVLDDKGNTVFEKTPIYVRDDFEGPLRSVLSRPNGALYSAAMAVKGKTMGLIMNSPLIHNAVEWGRAMPAMPGKVATFKVYFEGNRVKNDPAQMHEAIDAGLVPIGHRFFNQDISSIMEEPNLTPGRSLTAKLLGAVPGLFDEGAGNAVKAAIDKAGDFWHNTLLWDRVGDLQAGLYSNFRDNMLAKDIDRGTATKIAAHFANRFAGSLPVEAMSDNARKVANFFMFSRTFTMGNLGVMKDMLTGLPKDVLAQLERDGGFGAGAIGRAEEGTEAAQEGVKYAKSLARRKAMAVVATDIGLMYVGNSVLQSAFNVMRGDNSLDQEMHGYAQRFSDALSNIKEHPLSLLQPFDFMQRMSSTNENEPGKGDRIKIGYAKDGTAIYARNPVGKIGEEFEGWMTGPLDMMRRKLGTIARPAWQIMSNDAGFGRKVYDPNADTPAKYLANLGKIAKFLAESQLPEGQISAASDLVKGEGDATVNKLQAFGPVAGVTFSKGAPGGPAVGEMYHAKEMHDYAVQAALPDIRRQIQNGDIDGAREKMTELGIPPGLQRFYMRTTMNPATRLSPHTLKDFYQYATPEQRQRLEDAR